MMASCTYLAGGDHVCAGYTKKGEPFYGGDQEQPPDKSSSFWKRLMSFFGSKKSLNDMIEEARYYVDQAKKSTNAKEKIKNEDKAQFLIEIFTYVWNVYARKKRTNLSSEKYNKVINALMKKGFEPTASAEGRKAYGFYTSGLCTPTDHINGCSACFVAYKTKLYAEVSGESLTKEFAPLFEPALRNAREQHRAAVDQLENGPLDPVTGQRPKPRHQCPSLPASSA
jgi:hypothetical protein